MTSPPGFPRHHPRPPHGWVNDPNGPILWGGRYHLFFQHNPEEPVHDRICWGHASSSDLVAWDYHPVALEPAVDGPDSAGCWSGCVVDDRGLATAVYTGVAGEAREAAVCLATSRDADLVTWTKHPEPVALLPTQLGVREFRDPFVFEHEGRRHALVGAGTAEGGAVLLYECDDLTHWTLLGTFLDAGDEVARGLATAQVWECPALCRLDDRWVLMLSLIRDDQIDQVVYLVGDLVAGPGGPRFQGREGGLVDHGRSFYAPTLLVERDRVLLWGWVTEDPPHRVTGVGWSGALTLTRELALGTGGRLVSRPVPALERLHTATTRHVLSDRDPTLSLPEAAVDLVIELEPGPDGRCEIEIADTVALGLDLDRGCVSVRRLEPGATATDIVEAPWKPAPGSPSVRAILDGSVLEVYASDGPTFTERIYSEGPPTLRLATPDGRCTLELRELGS